MTTTYEREREREKSEAETEKRQRDLFSLCPKDVKGMRGRKAIDSAVRDTDVETNKARDSKSARRITAIQGRSISIIPRKEHKILAYTLHQLRRLECV